MTTRAGVATLLGIGDRLFGVVAITANDAWTVGAMLNRRSIASPPPRSSAPPSWPAFSLLSITRYRCLKRRRQHAAKTGSHPE